MRVEKRCHDRCARGLNCVSSLAGALMLFFWAGCAAPSPMDSNAAAEIRAALNRQVREWNAGNLAGFMETYARSDQTRFVSGGEVMAGWQNVFERYRKKYGNRAAMGTLTFSELDVTPLGPDSAVAFGRWHLQRESDQPSGLFTLIFRKGPRGWRIVHDHTSSAERK